MKVSLFYLFILVSSVWAYFTPQQLEILDLHYRIQPKKKDESDPVRTFYSVLSVPKNVNEQQLEKAYKKLSRKWHPDKFIRAETKERKRAERKFETLSLIMTILRDVERRKNYDYFVKNGFPVWDKSKASYVFKNRSKPNFTIIAVILLAIVSGLQFLMLKMNKSQLNKRVAQTLRDVKWKADNMTKQDTNNNKIMELPEDYEVGSNIASNYIVDDRLVTYCGKIFIVKPDGSVLLYDDDDVKVDDQQQMNDFIVKIIDSGMFTLYGVQKRTRKEKRMNEKSNNVDGSPSVIDKFVQFRENDRGIKLSDWFLIKLVLCFWRLTVGKLIKIKRTAIKNENTSSEDTTSVESSVVEPVQIKKNDDKLVLPNGKILHARKK